MRAPAHVTFQPCSGRHSRRPGTTLAPPTIAMKHDVGPAPILLTHTNVKSRPERIVAHAPQLTTAQSVTSKQKLAAPTRDNGQEGAAGHCSTLVRSSVRAPGFFELP